MEFQFIVYNREKKLERGVQTAANAEVAARLLTSRGYRVLSVKSVPAFLPRREQVLGHSKVPVSAVVTFSRQWALLLEAGTDTVTSLEILAAQTENRYFKEVLGKVTSDLRRGQKLSSALAKYPGIFSRIYINSVMVGERAGGIEISLRQVADYMEKEDRASKSVKNALKYPAIVTVVAFVVVAILTIFVLPALDDLYRSLGVKLPLITRIMAAVVAWLASYAIYLLGAFFMAGVLVYIYSKTPAGKLQLDSLILKLPILGRIIHLDELVHFCRSMSLLHRAGLPLPDILTIVIESSNNAAIKQALSQVHRDVLRGDGLSNSLTKNPMFMSVVVQMVTVGEKTGNLDTTLAATAESLDTEARDRMNNFIELIQPTIIVILGVIVALIALSLISAMYSIYGSGI